MKVGDLIDALSVLDNDADVVLSSDPEGNHYSFLYGCDIMTEEQAKDYFELPLSSEAVAILIPTD